jgi:cytochrome c peroxidase
LAGRQKETVQMNKMRSAREAVGVSILARLYSQTLIWAGVAMLAPALVLAAGGGSGSDAQARAELGRALFFDTALSADGKVACATCHRPEAAFSGGDALARGVFGRSGTRNAPALVGLAGTRELFWDGRLTSLEELVLEPLTRPEEHGLADLTAVLSAIRARHSAGFARVFPREGVTEETVAQTLAAYVDSLSPPPSRFDRHQSGEADALTAAQRRGLALFTGRAACARCHPVQGGSFTDGAYHAGEVAPGVAPRLADVAKEVARMSPEARRSAVTARAEVAELGRYVVTLRPVDIGRFRTPSLRNVAVTAPYMHDGSVPTLTQAVERELYYRITEGLRVGDLTPAERADLVDFLQTLTSPPPSKVPKDAPATAAAVP